MKVFISELKNHIGQNIHLKGWVYNLRSSGKVCFILLRDGTGTTQCILNHSDKTQHLFKSFKTLTQESSLEVYGKVQEWKGNFEIEVSKFEIISLAKPFPISKKEHGIDFLMNHRHLWIRSKRTHAILRIRHFVTEAIHLFFNQKHFIKTDPPIFTPTACEGTSSLFKIETDFLDSVYLSQSGQMYLEALCASLGNVYCISPTFRAEKSSTRRHLMEFWMCEAEMAFLNLDQNMNLIEELIIFILQHVLKEASSELKTLCSDSIHIEKLSKIQTPFPRMHYEEACQYLLKKKTNFQKGSDFGGADETLLSSLNEKPLFIHHYPSAVKAFYMKQNQEHSLSCDLIAPDGYGELVGGGERETNIDILLKALHKHGLNPQDFEWYLDLRRYGTFTHSGFGLGIERLICWICKLDHVREAIAFPRVYGRKFFEHSTN